MSFLVIPALRAQTDGWFAFEPTTDAFAEKSAIERMAHALAVEHGIPDCRVSINAADDLSAGAVYITVTGTSGESGDDASVAILVDARDVRLRRGQ